MDRRKFLTVTGVSLGAGALYTMAPLLASNAEGAELARQLGRENGERPTPFTVVPAQRHPRRLGRCAGHEGVRAGGGGRQRARARAGPGALHGRPHPRHRGVRRARGPDEAIPGDRRAVSRCRRSTTFPASTTPASTAASSTGASSGPRSIPSTTRVSTSSRLDNVSRAKPEVGAEQRAWLAKDLARFPGRRPSWSSPTGRCSTCGPTGSGSRATATT